MTVSAMPATAVADVLAAGVAGGTIAGRVGLRGSEGEGGDRQVRISFFMVLLGGRPVLSYTAHSLRVRTEKRCRTTFVVRRMGIIWSAALSAGPYGVAVCRRSCSRRSCRSHSRCRSPTFVRRTDGNDGRRCGTWTGRSGPRHWFRSYCSRFCGRARRRSRGRVRHRRGPSRSRNSRSRACRRDRRHEIGRAPSPKPPRLMCA